jgi:Domain of unknown function (DUF4429)
MHGRAAGLSTSCVHLKAVGACATIPAVSVYRNFPLNGQPVNRLARQWPRGPLEFAGAKLRMMRHAEVFAMSSNGLSPILKADGHNGQVQAYEDRIVVRRRGILGFLTNGMKGDKTIPYSSITAVQYKKAGLLLNGYIQFSIKGGVEDKRGVFAATRDENTVLFRIGPQAKQFAKLRSFVENKIGKSSADRQPMPPSAADEIAKYAACYVGRQVGCRASRPSIGRTTRLSAKPFVLCSAAKVHPRDSQASRASSVVCRSEVGPDRSRQRGSWTSAMSAVRIPG